MHTNDRRRKKIWATGTADGIKNLQERIVEEVTRHCKDCLITHVSLNETKVSGIDGMNYAIEYERGSMSITPAAGQGLLGVGVCNVSIEKFYQDIVEPLKESIGGVTTGIDFVADNGAPARS